MCAPHVGNTQLTLRHGEAWPDLEEHCIIHTYIYIYMYKKMYIYIIILSKLIQTGSSFDIFVPDMAHDYIYILVLG